MGGGGPGWGPGVGLGAREGLLEVCGGCGTSEPAGRQREGAELAGEGRS